MHQHAVVQQQLYHLGVNTIHATHVAQYKISKATMRESAVSVTTISRIPHNIDLLKHYCIRHLFNSTS